jgi:hypothetical protein
MRRSRARALTAAVVILTAGVAAASLDLVVTNSDAATPTTSVGGDADIDFDGGTTDGGGEGGFDSGGEAGFDSGSDAAFDSGGEAGFDSGGEGGFDAPADTAAAPATIDIDEASIDIIGPQGVLSTATATVSTPDTGALGSATITSSDSSMKLSYCGGISCTWSAEPLPYALTVECVPGAMQTTGMLTVFEASSGNSSTAAVTCTPAASGPVLAVTPPNELDFMTVPVNQMLAKMIYVENTGGGSLDDVVIDFGTTANASQWQASACTAANPCSFGAGAGSMVTITFTPTSHGPKDVTLTATSSNGGSDSLVVKGTGAGGVMSVQTPPGPLYLLDIGIIPRNQAVSRDIVLENTGNAMYAATTSTPAAPYTIAAGPHPVAAMSTQAIAVTCMSATATTTNNPQSITITSDAYQGSPATVQVRCKVADTLLQIEPTSFDFKEIRVGTQPEPTKDILLTNPASSATSVQITKFGLLENTPGLSLTAPAVPFSIAPGSSRNATLKLSTAAETDLDGEFLTLTVDGTDLQFAVSGKVVTPHSRVVPPNLLDLGTACVGTDVSGNVMLINDGTATLAVEPPMMDQSFVASAPGTPAMLAPNTSLTATVTPMATATGSVMGTLTWRDDVPSEHGIGVKLDYVASGTALSPRGLDFGQVPVDVPGGPQHITLQNCDLAPTQIKIDSLKTRQGTLGAWNVEPRVGFTKNLAAKEQQAITVTFAPPARGRYEADLTVQTAAGKQIVHLVGDATGRDWDNTSFYACACNGPGAPSRGWPIVVAIVFVTWRRRRGSSSAR